MSKKSILVTFVSTIVVVVGVGLLSYFMFTNQPSADIVPPTPPTPPSNAPAVKPPVPPVPRLKGDILDDGIVNALDINSVIVHWKQIAKEYNLVDDTSEKVGTISALDLGMTIKYWGCSEAKGVKDCPYLTAAEAVTGTPTPTCQNAPAPCSSTGKLPAVTGKDDKGCSIWAKCPTATATSTSTDALPPVPAIPSQTTN